MDRNFSGKPKFRTGSTCDHIANNNYQYSRNWFVCTATIFCDTTGSDISVGRNGMAKKYVISVDPAINSILYPYANLFQLETMNYMIAAIIKEAPENRVSLANHKCRFLCWVGLSWFDKWRYIYHFVFAFTNHSICQLDDG